MRKVAYITLIFLVLTASWAAACECAESDKEIINKIFENADFVIIGKAVANNEFDKQLEQQMNLDNGGTDVLFQVDSVLKGDIQINQKLFIYQFAGSCTQFFRFGKSYIIFGNSINKFKKAQYAGKVSKGDIAPPPPPPYIINGELEVYADNKIVRFLNKQTKKYKTVTTDLCSSMYVNSEAFSDTMKHLKNK